MYTPLPLLVPHRSSTILLQQILQWAIVLRNAYVDPLNVLQAHVLQRLRQEEFKSEEEKQKLQDALVVTINGISAGMRNSG